MIKKLIILALSLISFEVYSQKEGEIIYLVCKGNEKWIGHYKNPTSEHDIEVEFQLNFNPKAKTITGATRLLAIGCFPTEEIDVVKSNCNCVVDENYIECKSIGYNKDKQSYHEDEFFVDRRTAKMTTNRQWYSRGKLWVSNYGRISCRKTERKF